MARVVGSNHSVSLYKVNLKPIRIYHWHKIDCWCYSSKGAITLFLQYRRQDYCLLLIQWYEWTIKRNKGVNLCRCKRNICKCKRIEKWTYKKIWKDISTALSEQNMPLRYKQNFFKENNAWDFVQLRILVNGLEMHNPGIGATTMPWWMFSETNKDGWKMSVSRSAQSHINWKMSTNQLWFCTPRIRVWIC